jgi:hypothetical protein
MTDFTTGSYCLNLHERYAPNWEAWECARELYANAKDAAPDDLIVNSPNANTLEIFTPTVPDLAELFIIGCGSKSPLDESIGQFGEGLKLTALAASRMSGSSLTLRLSEKVITFAIKEHFGQRVLFAEIGEAEPFEGFQCTLVMKGAGFALNGKVIDGDKSRWFLKNPSDNVQIFCKGVWICSLDEKDALASYNLNDLILNRDRSHADPWSIRNAIGSLLIDKMDAETATHLIDNPRSWEVEKCLSAIWHFPKKAVDMLHDAFRRVHGEKAVLSTDPAMAKRVREHGFKPVGLGDGLVKALGSLVQTDIDFLSHEESLEALPQRPEWSRSFAELIRLADILGLGSVSINVYSDKYGDMVGRADHKARVIWLNERLFNEHNRFERVRTFVHELGHIQAGGGDATVTFENSLDLIGGKLALLVLDTTAKEVSA